LGHSAIALATDAAGSYTVGRAAEASLEAFAAPSVFPNGLLLPEEKAFASDVLFDGRNRGRHQVVTAFLEGLVEGALAA
jgi:hypothetical protein